MSGSAVLMILLGAGVVTLVLLLWLLGSHKVTEAERERNRRLAVNAVGRLTEGELSEVVRKPNDSEGAVLVFYRYWVAGVEYSTGQDLTGLGCLVRPENYLPGATILLKYDPQNPSNSIVACEGWSGLQTEVTPS